MKTLIVFSSKYGTTEECAKIIAKEINGETNLINLKREQCQIINSYDTILIGGSIYVGKLGEEVKKFIESHKESLSRKEIGLFVCCKEEGEKAKEFMKTNFPEWIMDKAFIKEHLGHEINLEKMNFLEKVLLKGIFKVKESYSNIDYDGIRRIAEKVKEMDIING